jgi:hypothetical protein
LRNGPACKEKWASIYDEYRRIQDYMVGTGHNEEKWSISPADKMAQDLPRVFVKSICEMMDAFKSSRPNFEPPQSQDFMDPNNNVFNPKFVCQEFETAVAQDPSSPMTHDDLTPLDLIPYLYNYPKPRYTVSMPKTLTQRRQVLPHPEFIPIRIICCCEGYSTPKPWYSS